MKKALIFLLILVVIAAQVTVISCFHSESISPLLSENSAIVLSKADYAFLRAYIEIAPTTSYDAQQNSEVVLQFSDGSQKEITTKYSFEVFLTRTGNTIGSFSVSAPTLGIELSDANPVHVTLVSNATDNFQDQLGILEKNYRGIDVYWIIIHGSALVNIKSYSLGI
jgi:hypothetical protein